jgi:hypothetical protein
MRKEEITIHTFSELSDDAKERAREWFRQGIQFDAAAGLLRGPPDTVSPDTKA